MSIASAKQLGDSQQKMKTNLSTWQRTTQFTERSNFHAQTGCSSAFNSVLEVEYTKFVGTFGYLVIVATILTMKVGS